MRGRVRRAAPVVGDPPVGEVGVDVARMRLAALANELEKRALAPALRHRAPGRRHARMHQPLNRARDEAVVDENVLLDRPARRSGVRGRRRGSPLRGDGASSPGRAPGPDRIGLNEPEPVDRVPQRGWREQAATDRESAQGGDGCGRSHRFYRVRSAAMAASAVRHCSRRSSTRAAAGNRVFETTTDTLPPGFGYT